MNLKSSKKTKGDAYSNRWWCNNNWHIIGSLRTKTTRR